MKAIIVNKPGGVEQLQLSEQPKPDLNNGEILVRVKAAGINRTDIVNRQNKSGYLNHPILGVEVAGVVEKVSPEVDIPIGTRVMGLVNGGGYAEYAVMPANRAMIIPENLSFTEAAAIPEVFLTAFQTLFWLGDLKEKETVLIHAGGSGVGTAAIQLAKQLKNATVITTAGSQQKLDTCTSLGANQVINYKQQAFEKKILDSNRKVDVILDFVGASYFKQNLAAINTDGRWILIGVLGGTKIEDLNLMELMVKRIQIKGTLLTPRSDQYKAELTKDFIQSTKLLFEQGKLKPIIDTVYSFEHIQDAHLRMETNKNIGKIILSWD